MKHIWEWYDIPVSFLGGVILMFMGGLGALVALNLHREATILGAAIGWPVVVAIGLLAVICWIINSKRPWEPDRELRWKAFVLGLTAGLLVVGSAVLLLLWPDRGGGNGAHTVLLAAQTVVLAITAGFVVWYAHAAHRQAEILKDQFDVQYTPHLRPAVRCPEIESKSVIIRLRNLAGAAAIHPGVYPKWETGKGNQELVPESACDPNDLKSCLRPGADFTLPVMEVGLEAWLCRVPMPPGGSGKVEVQWGEHPWEKRNTRTWTLEHNPEKENEWHFVYGPEE